MIQNLRMMPANNKLHIHKALTKDDNNREMNTHFLARLNHTLLPTDGHFLCIETRALHLNELQFRMLQSHCCQRILSLDSQAAIKTKGLHKMQASTKYTSNVHTIFALLHSTEMNNLYLVQCLHTVPQMYVHFLCKSMFDFHCNCVLFLMQKFRCCLHILDPDLQVL
jgi:hypothetical protein